MDDPHFSYITKLKIKTLVLVVRCFTFSMTSLDRGRVWIKVPSNVAITFWKNWYKVLNAFQKLMQKLARYYGNSKPLVLIIMIGQSETRSTTPSYSLAVVRLFTRVSKLGENVVPQPLCWLFLHSIGSQRYFALPMTINYFFSLCFHMIFNNLSLFMSMPNLI